MVISWYSRVNRMAADRTTHTGAFRYPHAAQILLYSFPNSTINASAKRESP